jgi:hypothetical protein
MFVVVAKPCDSCGGEMRVRLMTTRPTDEDVVAVAGPGSCTRTEVVEVEPDGATVATPERY